MSDMFALIRDLITLFIAGGIFVWSLKKTWQQVAPFIVPAVRWLRDRLISDHIKEEEDRIESLETRVANHERRRHHEQD